MQRSSTAFFIVQQFERVILFFYYYINFDAFNVFMHLVKNVMDSDTISWCLHTNHSFLNANPISSAPPDQIIINPT